MLGDALGPQLAALHARAKAFASLTDRIKAALPERVRTHVLSASWRGDRATLVVLVDSGAWTLHVHFACETLREALTKAGERDFTRLMVRVSAPTKAAP